jgi:hypothetical protein
MARGWRGVGVGEGVRVGAGVGVAVGMGVRVAVNDAVAVGAVVEVGLTVGEGAPGPTQAARATPQRARQAIQCTLVLFMVFSFRKSSPYETDGTDKG